MREGGHEVSVTRGTHGTPTHRSYMTEFVPSNSEQLERVDAISYDGDVPKSEYNDCHGDYLPGDLSSHAELR